MTRPTPETPVAMPEIEQRTATIEPADTMTEQQLIEGLAAHGYHVFKDEQPVSSDLPSALAATKNQIPQRNGVKEIFEAIAPVMKGIALTDLNETADNASVILEITGKEAKVLSSVYSRATGGADAS